MEHPNLFTSQLEPDTDDPAGFRAGQLRVSELLGASELVVKLLEIAPGNHLCPYHYEYVEEWLVVLTGEVDVRVPTGPRRLVAGDVMRFATGPEGAHRVSSPPGASEPSRVLMFSADADPAVTVYPDSDKLAVYSAREEDEVMVRRADPSSHLRYYDGESA
jgi:uncharacterized cupin superfamily protein